MKKILLYQHQSSMNHGCEALVYTISKQIKDICPDSEITLSSYFKADDEQFEFPNVDHIIQNDMWLVRYTVPWFVYQVDKRLLNSESVQERFMYCKPCYEAAGQSDICIAIGGDTYCYNKGKEHWPLERKIKKLDKKMMLWGCSIEPQDLPGEMSEHLSRFDVITARDPISYEALTNSHIESRICRCADPAFLLPMQACPLPEGWEEGKMVGLNFSPMVMGQIQDKAHVREAVGNLIEYILRESDDKVVLIPHVRLSFNDDMTELRPLYEKYEKSGRVLLIDHIEWNARQLKYLISKCKLFIGARTHATIAAYSANVPTLSIGYSVKARGIARDLFGKEEGMTVSVREISQGDLLIRSYRQLYDHKDEVAAHLSDVMPQYCETALDSGKAFRALLR